MSRQSSIEISASQPTEPEVPLSEVPLPEVTLSEVPLSEVPLSERPLIVVDQNTVISPELDSIPVVIAETPLSATAQEIRDRLFALPDVAGREEHAVRMGDLEVKSRIGSGGMGAVFKAVDLELSRTIALKILHPTIAADPSLVARFRNEARACAELGHDNIARVFFAGEHDGVHYIAYEYAEGRTLKQLIDEHRVLSPEETVNYAIQTTLALNHMHSAGIIHRDIKPSNIILTTTGRIKVVDLGLALRDSRDSIGDLTVAGTTLGTFDYMAPEQARDPHAADIRSDIYSLGCTLYHMLTGQPPYPDGTAVQKMLDHQGKAPPDPRLISKDLPAEVVAVVQKMMNTNPDERYLDPGQLLSDLMDVASWMGLRSVPAEGLIWRRVPVTRVRELSGALFVTGAVVAICLTALAMHFLPSSKLSGPDGVPEWERFFRIHPPQVVSDGMQNQGPVKPSKGASTPDVKNAAVGTGEAESFPIATTGDPDGSFSDVPPVREQPLGPFIVYHPDGKREAVSSLQKAWGEARNGDVIELNFTGPRAAPTYRLGALLREQQHITIRAAAGHSPVVVFEGGDRLDRATFPGQLFYLSDNLKLTISGIHFQVNVKADVDDDKWVLFECNGSNRVDMQDCRITVENRAGVETSVFRFNDQTSVAYAGERTAITLKNVVIRGGCDLVQIDDQAGGSVTTQNCVLAINGSLVNNRGSDARVPSGELALNMTHTTSILAQPAIRMRDSEYLDGGEADRTLPRVDVTSEACVFSSLDTSGTLIDIKGNAYREALQDHLTWNGNQNLYHHYVTFWVIESASLDGDVRPYYFNEWVSTWDRSSLGSEVAAELMLDDVWQNLDASPEAAMLSRLPVGAFELNRRFFYDMPDMPARHAVDKNGAIIGADILQLRHFPAIGAVPAIVEEVQPEPVVEPTPTPILPLN